MNLNLVHYYPRAWAGDGGCTSAMRGWATALAAAGAQVTVVSDGQGERPLRQDVRWLATPHRGWGRGRAPIGLERLLGQRDVLVLHSGWVYHNVKAARSAARVGVPYVLTPHGAYDPNIFERRHGLKHLWWSVFEKRLVAGARAIHVFFDDQRDELRDLGYTGAVVVAPSGLTVPQFETNASRSRSLLWMGRFDIQIKGLDLLLHALASLPASVRPQARLHGPDWRGGREETGQLARRLGLADSVAIGPPLYGSAKWDALRECGVFVFPSRWEGQGLMALEAAAAAAPLVVTRTTTLARHLAAADAAILVEPEPASIAAGIVKALSVSESKDLGGRAARLVREKFSWPAVADSYAAQLTALL
jgi:glycosyltransferase involved in cell wall biosynthesis